MNVKDNNITKYYTKLEKDDTHETAIIVQKLLHEMYENKHTDYDTNI